MQAGDADHEELVEVRVEDREELDPLEQRLVVFLGLFEDAELNSSQASSGLKYRDPAAASGRSTNLS